MNQVHLSFNSLTPVTTSTPGTMETTNRVGKGIYETSGEISTEPLCAAGEHMEILSALHHVSWFFLQPNT